MLAAQTALLFFFLKIISANIHNDRGCCLGCRQIARLCQLLMWHHIPPHSAQCHRASENGQPARRDHRRSFSYDAAKGSIVGDTIDGQRSSRYHYPLAFHFPSSLLLPFHSLSFTHSLTHFLSTCSCLLILISRISYVTLELTITIYAGLFVVMRYEAVLLIINLLRFYSSSSSGSDCSWQWWQQKSRSSSLVLRDAVSGTVQPAMLTSGKLNFFRLMSEAR